MKKVVVIAGVTAAGKTSLSIELAKRYNGEIISADSVSVYKELNIGSAKPTKQEREGIKHHLIDVSTIENEYNVYEYQKQGREVIDEIIARNKLPIIVGGTGLYINALIYDYHFDQTELVDIDETLSNQELKEQLEQIDPKSAKKIHINNRKRLIRALKIVKTHGVPRDEVNQSNKDQLVYDAKVFFLQGDRKKLYQRINQRVDEMFDNGLIREITTLYEDNVGLFDYKSMNAIGYYEFKDYFPGNISINEVKELIKRNTRRLAKRQITWFKHQTKSEWIDIFEDDYHLSIKKKIDEFLKE